MSPTQTNKIPKQSHKRTISNIKFKTLNNQDHLKAPICMILGLLAILNAMILDLIFQRNVAKIFRAFRISGNFMVIFPRNYFAYYTIATSVFLSKTCSFCLSSDIQTFSPIFALKWGASVTLTSSLLPGTSVISS